MNIILVPITRDEEPEEISGTWRLTIYRGPTMMRRDEFTNIHLEVQAGDGTRTRIEIDPNAPTIDTIDTLGRSESPILRALFRGLTHMEID